MNLNLKHILVISYLLFTISSFAQISSDNGNYLQASFLKRKIETDANASIFNLLTIKNLSSKNFSGSVKYSIPDKWSVLGEKRVSVNIQAKDSIVLPVRISVSNKAVGEVGYALIATIMDNHNRQVLSEYSFIVIPRITQLKTTLLNKTTYFNNKNAEAKIYYKVENKGNTNEVVHLEIDGKNTLSINNARILDIYSNDINIPPNTDTIIDFSVRYNPKVDLRKYYFLEIKVSSSDTSFTNLVWANRVENKFYYKIPEYYKCGIFQIIFNNLLQENPSISFWAKGNVLFKNRLTLYYYLRPATWNSNILINDLYKTSSIYYLGLKNDIFDVRVGTIYSKLRQRYFGTGASTEINLKNISALGFYVMNNYSHSNFYGGSLGFRTKKKLAFNIGYAEMNYDSLFRNSQITTFSTRFKLTKNHSISIYGGGSQTTDGLNTNYEPINYEFGFRYNGYFNKFRIDFNSDYGTPEYTGLSAGRFYVNALINYTFNKKNNLYLSYVKQDYNPAVYYNGILQPIRYTKYDEYKLELANVYNKSTVLYYGLNFISEQTDQIVALNGINEPFATHNYRVYFKTLIKLKYKDIKFIPQIDFGKIDVIEGYDYNNNPNKSIFTYNFYFNVTARNSGLLMYYRNGPYRIYEQYYYYTNAYLSKRVFFTAFWDKYLLNNLLLLNVRANYQSNLFDNTNIFNLQTQFTWYFPKDWSVYILSNYSLRTLKDARTNASYKYSQGYLEVGIRKEINCRQPRIQFYDLKIVFFRDINGNRIKEVNEPGINDVLSYIKIDPDNIIKESSAQFVSTELLSGADGEIEYKNIPNGNYILNFKLIGNIVGNFSRESLELPFSINEDKIIYVPYLENNRIIGKIILNRDPLSALGNIDLGNIRVIAEDTKGNTYSALTDNQGKFVIYTPVADHYVVRVNNIFYESFDLQQPEFVVKFNGYKQFEVSFVFNEKKRKINFDNQITEESDIEDIQLIRKTTLTGKIRDAISLEPVEAEIKIIDNKTNKEVSRAVSNKITGNYSISYVAGTHYRMEVVAKGYWEHVENLYIEQVISIQNINKDIMLNKLGENPEEQKTYIIYKKEEDFTENFKQGQQIPINYLNFDLKQTRLNPEAYPELDRLIELLNKNKTVNIEIAGYSDDQSNDRVEKIIALRRAKAVAKYLTMHGLNENRITVKSYGNSRPLVPGANEKARKKNRRVEIIVR